MVDRRTAPDFERARRRGAFEAWLLQRTEHLANRQHGRHKRALIGALRGTIVELGPGTGANLDFYGPGVHLIAVEPNPAMHARLIDRALTAGVDMELRTVRGEQLDIDSASVDAVVSTFVLCGVEDVDQVLAEVGRILRPGGTFVFLDHVAAPAGTWTRRLQALVKRPHRWAFNGCEVDRDIADHLHRAGFTSIDIHESDGGARAAYLRHQIIGSATV